jgi:hypothetical protein
VTGANIKLPVHVTGHVMRWTSKSHLSTISCARASESSDPDPERILFDADLVTAAIFFCIDRNKAPQFP